MKDFWKVVFVIIICFVLTHFGLKAYKNIHFQETHKTVGVITKKAITLKNPAVVISYHDHRKRKRKKALRTSDEGMHALPMGYPFTIEYSVSKPNVSIINKFDFPQSALDSMNTESLALVTLIEEYKTYSLDGPNSSWDVVYRYRYNGSVYTGVRIFSSRPSFDLGSRIRCRLNSDTPSISFLDTTSVLTTTELINALENLGDSIHSKDSIRTEDSVIHINY
jgi:hypothetical protein